MEATRVYKGFLVTWESIEIGVSRVDIKTTARFAICVLPRAHQVRRTLCAAGIPLPDAFGFGQGCGIQSLARWKHLRVCQALKRFGWQACHAAPIRDVDARFWDELAAGPDDLSCDTRGNARMPAKIWLPVDGAARGPHAEPFPRFAWAWLDDIDVLQEVKVRLPALQRGPRFMTAGARHARGKGPHRLWMLAGWKLFLLAHGFLLHVEGYSARLPCVACSISSPAHGEGCSPQRRRPLKGGRHHAPALQMRSMLEPREPARWSSLGHCPVLAESSLQPYWLSVTRMRAWRGWTQGGVPPVHVEDMHIHAPTGGSRTPLEVSSVGGFTAGPSGDTIEQYKLLLDDAEGFELLVNLVAHANVPFAVITPWRYPTDRRCASPNGIATGDVF